MSDQPPTHVVGLIEVFRELLSDRNSATTREVGSALLQDAFWGSLDVRRKDACLVLLVDLHVHASVFELNATTARKALTITNAHLFVELKGTSNTLGYLD